MKKIVWFMSLTVILVGCSTNSSQSLVKKSSASTFSLMEIRTAGKSADELKEENQKQLEEKLGEVLSFCLPRLSGYEKASADQAMRAYWLSMTGLVAGSVLAPGLAAANASANAGSIAALSGWAGATNFAGQAFKTSGLSGSAIAETRNGIIKNVRDNIEIASDGSKTFDQRRDALMKARSECIVYEIAVPNIPQAN